MALSIEPSYLTDDELYRLTSTTQMMLLPLENRERFMWSFSAWRWPSLPGFRPFVQLELWLSELKLWFLRWSSVAPGYWGGGGGSTVGWAHGYIHGWAMLISTHTLVLWPQEVQEAIVFSSGCWHGPAAAIDIDMICCSHLMITLCFSYENMDGKINVPWIHHGRN